MIDKLQKIVFLRKENTLPAYMRPRHQSLGFSGWLVFDKNGVLDRWISLLEQRLTKPAPDAGDSADSSELVQASALSTSQTLSSPQRG